MLDAVLDIICSKLNAFNNIMAFFEIGYTGCASSAKYVRVLADHGAGDGFEQFGDVTVFGCVLVFKSWGDRGGWMEIAECDLNTGDVDGLICDVSSFLKNRRLLRLGVLGES